MSFDSLGLDPSLVATLAALGYEAPTPVQQAAIPAALTGVDLLVSSQTGSGKTAVFVLPALQRLLAPPSVAVHPQAAGASGGPRLSGQSHASGGPRLSGQSNRRAFSPRILVLAPTRELALQVQKATHGYGQGQRLRTACLVGGMSYGPQLKQLSRPLDIAIATPGRLKDHLERGSLNLSCVEILVLDEADRMLDMGFQEDIDHIVALTPAKRQTMLFSATLEGVVGRLAQRVTKAPRRIDIAPTVKREAMIEQHAIFADNFAHKTRLLDALLKDEDVLQALIFTATRRSAEDLSDSLQSQGHAAGALHGDMHQRERNFTLQRLRDGNMRMLVATDVAARGLDVPGITHVINFDAPRQAEDYVHRIGRTGRAGRAGVAVTLVGHAERDLMRSIERYTGNSIRISVIPGLEPSARPENRARPPQRKNGYGYEKKRDDARGARQAGYRR